MDKSMEKALNEETEIKFTPEPVTEESVSFGRFDNDILSWEKWSSFSQNKYMEEAEKCSTPGSVAKKKAYFEAHYKKIGARQKAESVPQEQQQMEGELLRSDEPYYFRNSTANGCESEAKNEAESEQLTSERMISSGNKELDSDSTDEVISSANVDEPSQESTAPTDQKCLVDNETGLESDTPKLLTKSESSEAVVLVTDEKFWTGSAGSTNLPKQFNLERNKSEESRPKQVKKESPKETPASKEKNMGNGVARTNKKPAVAVPNLQRIPISRVSKIITAPPSISAPRNSTRKGILSLSRGEKPSVMETQKATATNLCTPLSLGSTGADSAPPTKSRRTSIMEKMGDKEIIQRAFKTFRNSLNLTETLIDAKSSAVQQVFTKGTKQQASFTSITRKLKDSGKDLGGTRKTVEKTSPQRGQVGPRWHSVSPRPLKSASGSKTSTNPKSSGFYLRSNERAVKRREFIMKLVENSNAKEVEKSHTQLKSREEKEMEIKKLRQSLNFKATPMPDFYQENGVTKIPGNKEGVNYGSRHEHGPSRLKHEVIKSK